MDINSSFRRWAVVSAAIGVVTITSASASASIGTGVGASPIALTHVARPGHRYRLPSLLVVNTGTVRTRYDVRVKPTQWARQRPVSSRWIVFDHRHVTLKGGQATIIGLTLVVPRGVLAGPYVSDILVTSEPQRGGTTNLTTGAETTVRVTVGPARRQ